MTNERLVKPILTILLVIMYSALFLFHVSRVQLLTMGHFLTLSAFLPTILLSFSELLGIKNNPALKRLIKWPRMTQTILILALCVFSINIQAISLKMREWTLLVPCLLIDLMSFNEWVHREPKKKKK